MAKKPCLAPEMKDPRDKLQLTPWFWVGVNLNGEYTRHPIDAETPPNRAVLDAEDWTRLKTVAGILHRPVRPGDGCCLTTGI